MIIHVMIMTYNIWMSIKEACLKYVFNTGTSRAQTEQDLCISIHTIIQENIILVSSEPVLVQENIISVPSEPVPVLNTC